MACGIPSCFGNSLGMVTISISGSEVKATGISALTEGAFVVVPGVPLTTTPKSRFSISMAMAGGHGKDNPGGGIRLGVRPADGLRVIKSSAVGVAVPRKGSSAMAVEIHTGSSLKGTSLGFVTGSSTSRSMLASDLDVHPSVPCRIEVGSNSAGGSGTRLSIGCGRCSRFRRESITASGVPASFVSKLHFFLRGCPCKYSRRVADGTCPCLCRSFMGTNGGAHSSTRGVIDSAIKVVRSEVGSSKGVKC